MNTTAFKRAAKRYAARHSITLHQAQEDLSQILGFKNLHAALARFAKNDPAVAVRAKALDVNASDGEQLFQNLGKGLLALEKQMGSSPEEAREAVEQFMEKNVVIYAKAPVAHKSESQLIALMNDFMRSLPLKRKALPAG